MLLCFFPPSLFSPCSLFPELPRSATQEASRGSSEPPKAGRYLGALGRTLKKTQKIPLLRGYREEQNERVTSEKCCTKYRFRFTNRTEAIRLNPGRKPHARGLPFTLREIAFGVNNLRSFFSFLTQRTLNARKRLCTASIYFRKIRPQRFHGTQRSQEFFFSHRTRDAARTSARHRERQFKYALESSL